ncbi:MAG: glycosyltransferase [Thermoanaerobaculia bacterium]|nr:glycosyltransferase [Thermoanaerobaculia bacterium]
MSRPSVSVLIPQWGATDLTQRAVDAVRRVRYEGWIEVLVWDNDSPDGPGLVSRLDDLTLVTSATNVGFGPANNGLAERAEGELLWLLNNDTVPAPQSLGRMVDCLLADERTVAVTPQFRTFDGRVLELGSYVSDAGEAWQLLRGERPPRSLCRQPFEAHYGSAASLLVRRESFVAVGGFDDAFVPAYYEDTDLCLRLTADGGRVMVEPRAVVYHLEGGSAGRDENCGAKRHQLRNRGRFAARWSTRLKNSEPMGPATALHHALSPDDRPLLLWLLPDFLKPDQSGGHARVYKEMQILSDAGFAIVAWSEHLGDHGRYAPFLERLGIRWCGYQEPSRWLLNDRNQTRFAPLHELLEYDIWDAVVAWSADVGHRFGPLVRQMLPETPWVVDSAVLLYRQSELGLGVGAARMEDIVTEKAWELEVYGSADAVIASSSNDAAMLRHELPQLDVFDFDVGAYEPLPSDLEAQADGALVFLGSFVHPPNLDAVMWWLGEIHPRVAAMVGRHLPLRIIGASSELVDEISGDHPAVEIAGWVEDLGDELCSARAMLVPLRYGAGTKDKISMAMRYGVPTLTTNVGAESMPADLFEALWIADEPEQIAAQVVQLMTSDRAWAEAARSTRTAAQIAWDEQEQVHRRFVHWFSHHVRSEIT